MLLYNSLSNKKEEFIPIEKNTVKMYACGITPYDYLHIGHGMQAVIFDTIRRYFEYLSYNVTYVRNFTDIDDKIIDKAKLENKSSKELSEYYILKSKEDLLNLKVKPATNEPKVTDHINEIIDFIKELIAKGFAYSLNSSVYFNVNKFNNYGKLSNKNIDELVASEDSNDTKNSPLDFALWKAKKEGEPSWPSPWGDGRPGWHIECSTLSKIYLGDKIDIHGGGLDIIFPHHENEVAQSEALSGSTFANYWFHNGLVTIGKRKMSKSLGNGILLSKALKEYGSDLIRHMIFSFSFNSNINFEKSNLINAEKRIYYFYNTLFNIEKLLEKKLSNDINQNIIDKINNFSSVFKTNMDDNFNTAKVLAYLNEYFTFINNYIRKIDNTNKETLVKFLDSLEPVKQVLGLLNEKPEAYLKAYKDRVCLRENIDIHKVEHLLKEREAYKSQKDFKKADEIREELKKLNIIVNDNVDTSSTWYFSMY